METFARAGSLIGFPELVREHGLSPSSLLTQVGLSPGLLDDPDLYVPYPQFLDLLLLAAEKCRRKDFGLRLGIRQGIEVWGALGTLLCLQPTLGDALSLARKNLGFHARGIEVDLLAEGDLLGFGIDYVFSHELDCSQNYPLVLGLIVRMASQLYGSPLWPSRIEVSLNDNYRTGLYDEVFQCPVAFGAPRTALYFPAHLFDAPVHVQPDERAKLSDTWQQKWGAARQSDLPTRLDRAITALLPTGECSLETVSRVIGLHPRTVQSELKGAATSYGAILQAVRHRLACQHLSRRDLDLTSLALDLGYCELAPFSRAFKGWTGLSPAAWRKAQFGPGAP